MSQQDDEIRFALGVGRHNRPGHHLHRRCAWIGRINVGHPTTAIASVLGTAETVV
jgi:hypothetical protein